MKTKILKKLHITTLRTYITIVISFIITLALICAAHFFYSRTASILTENYKETIVQQLDQMNNQVADQISIIDSVNSLFLSNSLIRETLEPTSLQFSRSKIEKKLDLEKQMSYLLINTYLWNEKFIDSVFIFDIYRNSYSVDPSGNHISKLNDNETILKTIPKEHTSLVIQTLEHKDTVYFSRNIYSTYTGDYIATIIININYQTWVDYYSSNIDKNWFIYLYNDKMSVLTREDIENYASKLSGMISTTENQQLLEKPLIKNEMFFIAAERISNTDITSVVAAPKNQIYQKLNDTLKTYILVLVVIACITLMFAIILSRAVTRPIDKMLYYIQRIAEGKKEKMPALEIYSEFNALANAFNDMLEKLDTYYNDNFQKQLLLKNAEIQALQSQMDPHFLFNVLNTIAWKAQMTESQEIYQMVISLGELLKMNALSKDNAFIPLRTEIKYVSFYVYLQNMRFEDKFSIDMQINPELYEYKIPALCIQPLVENAIIHGLEPKKGQGRLIINIIEHPEDMEISIIDDGVGFETVPDIQNIQSSMEDAHTHIGLRNLDKRLFLLFGASARLHITSVPNVCTTISFKIPIQRRTTL